MTALRFLHIPKTAGSTFSSLLRRQYLGKAHFAFKGNFAADMERYQALPDSRKARIALFTGHAPLTTGIREADEAQTITFLRDPVSRVKSYCQHVSEGKSLHLREKFPPESFSLDAFLDSGDPALSNLQTKMLINDPGQTASPSLIATLSPCEARDRALENLFSRVFRFGLQDYFDESLMIFADALNWRAPLYAHLNKKSSARKLDFQSRHIERISELNAIDLEVYAAARQFFEADLESRLDRSKLKRFQNMQRWASPSLSFLHRVHERINKPSVRRA